MMQDHNYRLGFSRLELALVIAISLSVIGLLIPALETAREKARGYACRANLARIGVALHAYNSTFQYLPVASYWSNAEVVIDKNMRPAPNRETIRTVRQNWVQLLLPFLDESALAHEFDAGTSILSASNKIARERRLNLFLCPSDVFNSNSNQYILQYENGDKFAFARGNYAINGGPQTNASAPGRLSFPIASGNEQVFDSASGVFQWWGNGVAGFNKCFSLQDFQNGQGTMVAVDEVRAGIVSEDARGVWALGQIGSSVTWAHGINSDAFGPNNQIPDSDDILDGKAVAKKYGMDRFVNEKLPFCAHCSYANQATARSKHPGGVNILMLDGKSHFVSDAISPSLWHVMHGRDTPVSELENEFSERIAGNSPDPSELIEDKQDVSSTESNIASDLIVNSVGMRFARIPAGEFIMGLPDADNSYNYPMEAKPHSVRISKPYFLGIYEVTQGEYSAVTGDNPSWHRTDRLEGEKGEEIDISRYPVEQISWYEANSFCKKLSDLPEEKTAGRIYRLPSEAEWEYACRCGSSTPYPFTSEWGVNDHLGEIAGRNARPDNKPLETFPVGSFPSNKFGIYDMRGNVFEWCNDWFRREYYSISPAVDPRGPSHGYLKTVRGWDWTFIGSQCKDFLVTTAPWQRNRYIGFRLVCDQFTQ